MFYKIIKNIILAQVASDGGKNINIIPSLQNIPFKREIKNAYKIGYSIKDEYILNAIKIINTTPQCGINYRCVRTSDQNGYDSIVCYFDIKFNEKRYQISFHSPYNRSKLKKFISKGRVTHWDKKDCRNNAIALLSAFTS